MSTATAFTRYRDELLYHGGLLAVCLIPLIAFAIRGPSSETELGVATTGVAFLGWQIAGILGAIRRERRDRTP